MGACCAKKPVIRLSDGSEPWAVPYLSKLEGHTIFPGQSIIVRGNLLKKARFDINLTSGAVVEGDVRDDIILQVSTRPETGDVVCNSMTGGNRWGSEQTYKGTTFAVAKPFDYRIRIHEDHFEIFANHVFIGKFNFRMPLDQITHIYVNGQVELNNVSWEGKYYKVPYEAMIPGNFTAGRKLYVSGRVKEDSKDFAINLFADNGKQTAFQFNPRFTDKAIVRNAKLDNKWGKEERGGKMPMKALNTFDVVLACENDHFKCFIDDVLYCTFKHRILPKEIDKLSITGDVDFQSVHLK